MTGTEHFDKVIDIDQSPIGHAALQPGHLYRHLHPGTRGCSPACRSRAAAVIRRAASASTSRAGAVKPAGDGVIKVEMHFLPDIHVPCDQCKGSAITAKRWK